MTLLSLHLKPNIVVGSKCLFLELFICNDDWPSYRIFAPFYNSVKNRRKFVIPSFSCLKFLWETFRILCVLPGLRELSVNAQKRKNLSNAVKIVKTNKMKKNFKTNLFGNEFSVSAMQQVCFVLIPMSCLLTLHIFDDLKKIIINTNIFSYGNKSKKKCSW